MSSGSSYLVHLAAAACLFFAACAQTKSELPDWMVRRPTHPDYYFGVGTSGKTHEEERTREQAVERAMREIYLQARGECPYSFRFKEEGEDGSMCLEALIEDRTILTLSGLEVLEEAYFPESKMGFASETLILLVRLPKSAIR